MARIRSVHPAICEDETLVDVSPRAERTFVRLWTHLDDEGRCVDNTKLIKAALYPLHDDMPAAEVDVDLAELEQFGLIVRYEADGKSVLAAKPASWAHLQKPRHPAPSKLPPPPNNGRRPTAKRRKPPAECNQAPEDDGGSSQGVVGGVGEGEGVGEGGGEGVFTPLSSNEQTTGSELALVTSSPTATRRTGPELVFDAWKESTGKAKAQFTAERQRVVVKALKTYPVDDLVDAVRGWRHSRHHRGENDAHTVYNDIELLLRNARNVEKFRDLERGAGSEIAAFTTPGSWDALRVLEGT